MDEFPHILKTILEILLRVNKFNANDLDISKTLDSLQSTYPKCITDTILQDLKNLFSCGKQFGDINLLKKYSNEETTGMLTNIINQLDVYYKRTNNSKSVDDDNRIRKITSLYNEFINEYNKTKEHDDIADKLVQYLQQYVDEIKKLNNDTVISNLTKRKRSENSGSSNFNPNKKSATNPPPRGDVEWKNASDIQIKYWLSVLLQKKNITANLSLALVDYLFLALEDKNLKFKDLTLTNLQQIKQSTCPDLYDTIKDNVVGECVTSENTYNVDHKLPFIDNDEFITYIENKITQCYSMFKSILVQKIFAPYIALVQSSGSGKTRTLQELIKRNTFNCSYYTLALGENNDIKAKIRGLCEITDAKAIIEAKEFLKSCVKSTKDKLSVIIFDEGKYLLEQKAKYKENRNAFILLRKALSEICNIVMIIADTSSNITNFLPTLEQDVDHIKEATCSNIFPVLRIIPYDDIGFDIIKNDSKIQEELKDCTDDRKFLSYQYQVCLGRPLWIVNFISKEFNIAATINLAKQKLIRKDNVNLTPILGARLSLEVINSKLAKELVSQQIATLTQVSLDRERIYCSYRSEPIVSFIAANYMNNSDNLKQCLTCLLNSFTTSSVQKGMIGEIIGELILLRAIDLCINDKVKVTDYKYLNYFRDLSNSSYEISLDDFLSKLCNFSLFDDKFKNISFVKNKIHMLKDSGIYLTHFVAHNEKPTIKHLKRALYRGCGLLLRKNDNFPGVDIVIPFYSKTNKTPNGCIWVQVKNADKVKEIDKVTGEKLSPYYFFEENEVKELVEEFPLQIGIYLSLREKTSSDVMVKYEPPRTISISQNEIEAKISEKLINRDDIMKYFKHSFLKESLGLSNSKGNKDIINKLSSDNITKILNIYKKREFLKKLDCVNGNKLRTLVQPLLHPSTHNITSIIPRIRKEIEGIEVHGFFNILIYKNNNINKDLFNESQWRIINQILYLSPDNGSIFDFSTFIKNSKNNMNECIEHITKQ